MKVVCILFIILGFYNPMCAQDKLAKPTTHQLLLNLRTDPVMWSEIGYIYIGKRFQSFQVKGSFRQNYNFNENPKNIIFNQIGINTRFKSSFYYVKPGYLLARKVKDKSRFLLFANYLYAQGENAITIIYKDPLLGEVKEVNSQKDEYSALELEFNWQINLGKNLAISTGFNLGKKINQNPLLFQGIYNGAFSNRETYFPSVGYYKDAYLLLNLGMVVKLNRN
jgi:hypothetical protein